MLSPATPKATSVSFTSLSLTSPQSVPTEPDKWPFGKILIERKGVDYWKEKPMHANRRQREETVWSHVVLSAAQGWLGAGGGADLTEHLPAPGFPAAIRA